MLMTASVRLHSDSAYLNVYIDLQRLQRSILRLLDGLSRLLLVSRAGMAPCRALSPDPELQATGADLALQRTEQPESADLRAIVAASPLCTQARSRCLGNRTSSACTILRCAKTLWISASACSIVSTLPWCRWTQDTNHSSTGERTEGRFCRVSTLGCPSPLLSSSAGIQARVPTRLPPLAPFQRLPLHPLPLLLIEKAGAEEALAAAANLSTSLLRKCTVNPSTIPHFLIASNKLSTRSHCIRADSRPSLPALYLARW
jgi:hypothetical protein